MARYEQVLYDSMTADVFEISVDFKTRQLTMRGKSWTFGTDAELEAGYVAQMKALLHEYDSLRDLENAPARVAKLERMRSEAESEAKPPPQHRALAQLGDGAEYVIGIDFVDGKRGRSKIGGDPDLPKAIRWPGKRVFVAQLALAEVKPFDVSGWLPATGMIYYFISEDCTDNVALYSKARGLEPRKPPRAAKATADRYYRHELVERRMTFRGALTGSPNAKLVAKLAKQLGIPLVVDDPGARIFGEPTCEPGVSVFAPPDADDPDDPSQWLEYDGPLQLALQLPFSDGFLYLGVPPLDLQRGDLSRARATYGGT